MSAIRTTLGGNLSKNKIEYKNQVNCSYNGKAGSATMKKTNRMKLGALVLFMCICATIMMAGCSSETMGHWFSGGNIVINEVVTSNSASLLDDVYGSPDWIELYNKCTTDVNL